MSQHDERSSMKFAAAFLTIVTLTACASSTPDRAAKAASSLEVMQSNSSMARAQIDTVLGSLDTLLNAPAENLRETFDKYESDVRQMNDYAGRMRENDADLRTNGDAYLAQWQRDASNVSDPELRELARDRSAQIGHSSEEMRSTVTDAAVSFESFLSNLNDIRKVLGNDLTLTGQETIKRTEVVQTVRLEGARVKSAVQRAESSIEGFRSKITPSS